MITVRKALSYEICSGFRLVAGDSGLNNAITVVGFFEWEEDAEVLQAFIKGTFALTTLSMFKDDIKKAERNLKLMITNRVSAIAIKDIFFKDVSEDLKRYADMHSVPIFIFSDTYINEIFFVLQNAVAADQKYSVDGMRLESLLKSDLSEREQEKTLQGINQCLYRDGLTAMYFSDMREEKDSPLNLSKRYEEDIFRLEILMRNTPYYETIAYSFVNYRRGFFLLICENDPESENSKAFYREFVKRLEKDEESKKLFIGVSECMTAAPETDIKQRLQRAIFANVCSILSKEGICKYSDNNIDYVIFSYIGSQATERYYKNRLKIILDAEVKNHTPFLETILTYVKCGGSMDETAVCMHQHRNTIRYRIDKVHKILGSEDEIGFFAELRVLDRIYRGKPYLENMYI